MYGYRNRSRLPTSTMSSSGARFIPSSLLQNSIRFGKAVLLAYQSPPPLYFSLAIFSDTWADATPQTAIKMHTIVGNLATMVTNSFLPELKYGKIIALN